MTRAGGWPLGKGVHAAGEGVNSWIEFARFRAFASKKGVYLKVLGLFMPLVLGTRLLAGRHGVG